MGYPATLRRVAKRHNGVITSDPDGLLAALNIAKRLMVEEKLSFLQALDKALPRAGAVDEERTWWSAYKAVARHIPNGSDASSESVLAILADTIRDQGTINRAQQKGIRA
ncbi:hypothetical protein [Mycolicibacterium palauense]|uniref:hypothetical protein n=1 Tax=Mycolicibacterium palauense TaxID=2034511 RepID=UPI00114570CB|nr:hypothetical protein [Mycolicibacterium palauense]